MNTVELSTFFIDKRSKVSPHDQLLDDIIRSIINQTLLKEDTLPSVDVLADYFAIAPSVVKDVYSVLAKRGYLSANPPYKVIYEPRPNYYFLSRQTIAASLGKEPSEVPFKTLHHHRYTLKSKQALEKRFKPSEEVFSINRVFYSDQQPTFYARIEIPLSVFPDFLDHYTDQMNSWDIFEHHYQLSIDNRHAQLRVVALPKAIAEALNLPVGAPSYQLIAHVYDQEDRCIEYYEIYTPSQYFFQLKTPRSLLRQQFSKP